MQNENKEVKKKFYKRKRFWFLIVIVFFIIAGSNGSSNSTQTSSNNKAEPEQAIKVTAVKLVADYEANEVSADIAYKGKLVEVSGIISSIGKDITNAPYVTLSDGVQYSITSVQCMFDEENQDQLATLKKDTKITLLGRLSSKFGNVLVRDCAVVQ